VKKWLHSLIRSKIFYVVALLLVVPYLIPINQYQPAPDFKPFPESRFITLNDTKLHYREWNSGSAKGNVLFVHGFSGNTFCWRNNVDTLVKSGYHVVAVDMPAFGYSDKSTGVQHDVTSKASLFWLLCDTLQGRRWVLIGHSMGGSVVGAMGASRPSRTAGVVFTDGVYFSSDNKKSVGKKISGAVITSSYVKRWAEIVGKYGYVDHESFKELLTSAYAQPADSLAVEGYLAPFRTRQSAAAILEMGADQHGPTPDDRRLNMPLLVVWGDKDVWIPIESGKEFARQHVIDDFVVIEGAGHCPMETHPDAYNAAVVRFINKVFVP